MTFIYKINQVQPRRSFTKNKLKDLPTQSVHPTKQFDNREHEKRPVNFRSKFSCSHLNLTLKEIVFLISALASINGSNQRYEDTLLYHYLGGI